MGRRTEGEPVKDDIDERFDDVEEPELREAGAFQHRTSLRSKERDCATHDGPVSQPLHVIPRARALQRLEGKVSGHDPAEDGGEEAGGDVEEDEQGEEGGEAEDAVGFRDLGLLFQPLEGGVLRQLRAPSPLLSSPITWQVKRRRTHLLVDLRDVLLRRQTRCGVDKVSPAIELLTAHPAQHLPSPSPGSIETKLT